MSPTTIHRPRRSPERGIALLISLFVLLLISAIAADLILNSTTETTIDANYRTSVQAFSDARAGLEEGRGRLWRGSTNSLANWVAPIGTTLLPGQVRYIINDPAAAPNVVGNPYYDSEYQQEWGAPITTASVTTTNSTNLTPFILPNGQTLQGPLYKWVRITAATEQSTQNDVNGDLTFNNVSSLFYDGKQQLLSTQMNCPPLGVVLNSSCQAWQVFEVTALAVTPSGSKSLLQYVVGPTYLSLSFPSALTFDGPNPVYTAPNSAPFLMDGNDRSGGRQTTCPIAPQPGRPSMGGISNDGTEQLVQDIPSNRDSSYTGCVSATNCTSTPAVTNVSSSLDPTLQTPATLDALVQTLTDNATYVVNGPATGLPSYGTPTDPVIAVVTGANNGAGGTGDLTLSGGVTGYGILVVTGNFTFSGTSGWNGAVLVIGQGYATESGGGSNEFDGAFFIAKTRDSSGNELSTLGTPTLDWSGGGGNGIFYDSCWINNAGQTALYKVLSFRQIPQ